MKLQCYDTINALDNDFEYQEMKKILTVQIALNGFIEVFIELYESLKEFVQNVTLGLIEALNSFHKIIKNYNNINKIVKLTNHRKKRVRKKNLQRLYKLLI